MKQNLLMKLISIRMKAMIRNFGKSLPGKKKSKAIPAVFAFLLLYLLVAFEFIFVMLWLALSVFCTVGLTWLYFALSGFLAAALTVMLNVFATQNQMYNAKDNELLLAMPIPPRTILMSRMAVLLASSLGSTLLVMAPAVGVYIYQFGGLSGAQIVGVLSSVLAITLTAQAITCLLGFLLHLVLRRVRNKAVGSMVFTIAFLVVYFTAYSQAGNVITYLITNGAEVASLIQVWAAPVYALGLACTGEVFHSLLLILGSLVIFCMVYWALSATFIRSVHGTSARGKTKGRKTATLSQKQRSPVDAVCRKELRRLLTSPVYLTNMGLGVLMLLAAAVAVPFFSSTIRSYFVFLPQIEAHLPLLIGAMVTFLNGMTSFTAPSVSLEGKSLWVMRALPIAGRDVLLGKLKFHVLLAGSASTLAGLSVSITLGCGMAEVVLVTLLSAEIAVFMGMMGLIYNLLFPNFKWLNEAVPCKQGMPVLFSMLTGMGVTVLCGVIRYLLVGYVSSAIFLAGLVVLFAPVIVLLYRVIVGWGGRRFESFEG